MSEAFGRVDAYGPAPLDNPSVYPGRWPSTDVVLVDGCIWQLDITENRRLEQARAHPCDCPEHSVLRSSTSQLPLSYVLLRLNVTQMSRRRPFLAVGSNANPAQIYVKLQRKNVRPVVPFTIADVSGVDIGFSEHVAEAGYVPTTPVFSPQASREMIIIWLDEEQSVALTGTEPNYVPCVLSSPLTFSLKSRDNLDQVVAYMSKWGSRLDPAGSATLLAAGHGEQRRQQLELHQVQPNPRESGAPQDSDSLKTLGWSECATYGQQGAVGDVGYLVRPTTSEIRRDGDSVVVLNDSDYIEMGSPHRCLITSQAPNPSHDGPGVTVRCISSVSPARGEIWLDQVPRNALGIELGEHVNVDPVGDGRFDLGSLVVPKQTAIFCRVQAAPLTAMERSLVIIDPLAMDVMGVESGDQVEIKGVPEISNGKAPTIRARAIPATEELVQERKSLVGGGVESRFPSALDSLGVWPDLPWIFMDHALRERLNLGSSRVSAVHVRASRRDLLLKEARELLLLLIIAAIGLLTIIEDNRWRLVALSIVAFVGALVVVIRLRRKISKGSTS